MLKQLFVLLIAASQVFATCVTRSTAPVWSSCYVQFSNTGSPLQHSGALTVDTYSPTSGTNNYPVLIFQPGCGFIGTGTCDQLAGDGGNIDFNSASSFVFDLVRTAFPSRTRTSRPHTTRAESAWLPAAGR